MTQDPTKSPAVSERYLSSRFDWAAPGDQQEDAWLVRFCDKDCGDAIFTGADAEKEAWEYWERYAPSYNIYVFRLARLAPAPEQAGVREALEWYAEQVAGCRKISDLGRPYQYALDADGGKKARDALAALAQPEAARVGEHPLARMVAMDEEMEAEFPGWMTGVPEAARVGGSDDALTEFVTDAFNDLLVEHGAQGYGRDSPCKHHITKIVSELQTKVLAALATQPAALEDDWVHCSFCDKPATTDVGDDSDPLMPACAACYEAWQRDPGFTANDATQPAAASEEVRGTPYCPICGDFRMHTHSVEERREAGLIC